MRKPVAGRLLAALAAATALIVLSMQPNIASDTQRGYLDRTAYCFDLLINDTAAHGRECAGTLAPGASETLLDFKSGGGAKEEDPCDNGKGPGVIGNAGNSYDPCTVSSGFIAPFIGELIGKAAAIVWPRAEETSADMTAG